MKEIGASPNVFPDLILGGEEGHGIQIDPSAPDYGWADILGDISPDVAGVGSAVLAAYSGTIRAFFYNAGDRCDILYHIPHDYASGTDVHLHLHWSHVGTAISGSLVVSYNVSYAKGHNQAEFSAVVAPVLTQATPDIATVPAFRHRIDEIQISAASPSATQIDSSLIEPDGIILVSLVVTTVPTISGGTTNLPALHTCDLHYQTTSVQGTKTRTPPFYTA